MPLVTTMTAAKILDTSEDTVRTLERRGQLPAVRTPTGIRLFEMADVERLAEERAARRQSESSDAA